MKKCNKCLVEKETTEYYVNNRNKDKLDGTCKECVKEKNKQNKDKIRESQIKWREKNIHLKIIILYNKVKCHIAYS